MFTEAIEAILVDQCTPAAIRAIENGGTAAALWRALADNGFLELMASEAAGGAGLDLDAIFPIFVAFGRHAVPVPAAQSIAARALLRDVAAPEGMVTLVGHARREADGSRQRRQRGVRRHCGPRTRQRRRRARAARLRTGRTHRDRRARQPERARCIGRGRQSARPSATTATRSPCSAQRCMRRPWQVPWSACSR